jgi:hypothetical protein
LLRAKNGIGITSWMDVCLLATMPGDYASVA